MCFVYVVQHGAVLGINGGNLTIRFPDGTSRSVPKGLVEGISVFSNAVLTKQCIDYCLSSDVKVGFFASNGTYRGSLSPVKNTNTYRLRRQISLFDDETFCLNLAKRIVNAKIRNQTVVLRRYSYGRKDECSDYIHQMNRIAKDKIWRARSVNQIIGYEGYASRIYFKWISSVIKEGFAFESRNRRPSRDPFNSMLNYGYAILSKEMHGELENRSLNPYIGFVHKDKYGHTALVSDMIEEWRPVIVDSVVLSLIQGHEIGCSDFELDSGGCRMNTDAIKTLLSKLEQKMETKTGYLKYFDSPISFREAIWHQADRMSRFVDKGVCSIYKPVIIR